METKLSDMAPGEGAIVSQIQAKGGMRRRLQDMGIIEGSAIECVMRSPLGDPSAYLVKGALIALRSNDAKEIAVEEVHR